MMSGPEWEKHETDATGAPKIPAPQFHNTAEETQYSPKHKLLPWED
jgi:hypothetical protein